MVACLLLVALVSRGQGYSIRIVHVVGTTLLFLDALQQQQQQQTRANHQHTNLFAEREKNGMDELVAKCLL